MPIMNRMRENMGWIFATLAAFFLIMIVFEWGMDFTGLRSGGRGSRDIVGVVNGTKVPYRQFSEMVKIYSDNIKEQTGKEPEEDQLQQLRDQVWQTLVSQILVEQEVKRLGLSVSDDELVQWVRGPNPPEELRRSFIDSTGTFRQDIYEAFLANPNDYIRDPKGEDPDFGTKYLANYERNLRQRRLTEKLQSIILSTVRVSEGEVRQRFIEQHEKADAQYVAFDAALLSDSAVALTDADYKAYYDENIEQFKVPASRKLKYVLFSDKPTAADTSADMRDMESIAASIRSGADFLKLMSENSDRPDSGTFYHHGELGPAFEAQAFAAKTGDIVGPTIDGDMVRLGKVLGDRKSTTDYVRASHILFTVQPGEDSALVKQQAAEVAREARQGGDFARLAAQYSKDPTTASRGGELGWFTRGRLTPELEKAALAARAGEIVGPVKTPFGWEVIKVQGRDSRDIRLATITKRIVASPQTKSENLDRARDFAANARETDFAKEAQQTGLEPHESTIQEKSTVIPGLGMNEMLAKWVFDKKVGEVSDPFTVFGGTAVVTVTEAKEAGVRPFAEVKESLRPAVLRRKKIDRTVQLATEARAKLGSSDSLGRLAQVDPNLRPMTTGEFVIGSSAPGVGPDPAFLGAVQALPPGTVSAPVRGSHGAYLIQVLTKSGFDSTAYAAQHDLLVQRIEQDKKGRYLNEWMAKLREKAEIEDHRDQFFR